MSLFELFYYYNNIIVFCKWYFAKFTKINFMI